MPFMHRRGFLALPLTAAFAARRYRAVIIGHTGHGNYGHSWETAFTAALEDRRPQPT